MKPLKSIFIVLVLAVWPHLGLGAEMYAVVNAPTSASLDEASLLALLKGQRRNWDDGNAATVVLPSRESTDFEDVAERLFGASGRVMQRLWFRVVFSGRANAPTYIDDPSKVVAAVEIKAGAVGVFMAKQEPEITGSLRLVKLK
jgi:hypothetical protein